MANATDDMSLDSHITSMTQSNKIQFTTKLLQDLYTALSPVHVTILDALLKLLARSISPEALLSTFTVVFKMPS